jgi:colicin import membrane protein
MMDISKRSIEELSEPDLFKKMITISLILHVSFFLIMALKTVFFPRQSLSLDAAVRVDIVDLPDKISELPPQQSAPKETVKTPPQKEVIKQKEEPIALKKKKLTAIERIKQFEKEEKKKKSIEKIEDELKKQEAQEKAERARKYLVKGNAISPGTALKGLAKAEFNEYLGKLHSQIQEHWNLPEWLSNTNLKATVLTFIDHRGVVIKRQIERSSGDPRFDDFALRAVDESSPFPPPPEKFVDVVKVDGIVFRFPQ